MENIILALARPLPLLTLQEWAAIKITTMLSNNKQMLNSIMDFQDVYQFKLFKKEKEWDAVHSLANELFSRICNCTKFKKMILELLWPVSYRIFLWRSTYASSIGNQYLLRIYWTGRGKIDNKRTARYIIGNKNISIKSRFMLACSLCLNEEILELWREMSNDDRIFFEKKNCVTMRPLLALCVRTLKVHTNGTLRSMTKALECAITLGFTEAAKYLLSIAPKGFKNDMALIGMDKLSAKVETNKHLEEDEIEIGYLLFSHMWNKNQVNLFNLHNSVLTLSLIFHSSGPELFLKEFANRIPRTSMKVIQTFLYSIFLYYHLETNQDHDYNKIFVDIWRLIPACVKNSITANPFLGLKFLRVLIKDDSHHLLRGFYVKTKSQDSSALASITPYCFEEDNWEFLYFLIEEGIVTLSSLTKCRNVFLNSLAPRGHLRHSEHL